MNNNHDVFIETLQVWSSFLLTLGGERIVVHLTSISAILFPFLNRLDTFLYKTLSGVVHESVNFAYNDRSLAVLLLRMLNHDQLMKCADIIEKCGNNGVTA